MRAKEAALLAAAFAALAGGCSSVPLGDAGSGGPLLRLPATPAPQTLEAATAGSAADADRGERIATLAEEMLGVPYRWGGSTRSGFDCSGLVFFTHRRAGRAVPRTSREQYRAARRVELDDARPGDLLFFRSRNLSHVGIYVGDGRFVHAPSSGKRVSVARVSRPYYRERLLGVGRLY